MEIILVIYLSGVVVAAFTLVLWKAIEALVSFLMADECLTANFAQVGQYLSPLTNKYNWHRPTWKTYLGAICLGLAQSWIAVASYVYYTSKLLLMPFRALFITPPPLVSALRYPLRVSVLPRELAWARILAIHVATSESRLDAREIQDSLNEMLDVVEGFDVATAVQALQDIKTAHPELLIEPSVIQEALDNARQSSRERR